jgi:hypothetical protein
LNTRLQSSAVHLRKTSTSQRNLVRTFLGLAGAKLLDVVLLRRQIDACVGGDVEQLTSIAFALLFLASPVVPGSIVPPSILATIARPGAIGIEVAVEEHIFIGDHADRTTLTVGFDGRRIDLAMRADGDCATRLSAMFRAAAEKTSDCLSRRQTLAAQLSTPAPAHHVPPSVTYRERRGKHG